jgi:muramidase (phage lysozyme)
MEGSMTTNREAFRRMIRLSEGTANSPLTKNDGYDVIVTGMDTNWEPTPEVFTDYEWHPFAVGNSVSAWRPPKIINRNGLESTASGGYQILRRFWLIYQRQLTLPDFSPASQDLYADEQFRERKALGMIDAGQLTAAINAVAGLWASMPGPAYAGQSQHGINACKAFYEQSGGLYSPN